MSKSESFKRYEFKKFCFIIGFKQSVIIDLLNNIDSNYNEWTEVKVDKQNNIKKYMDGTEKKRTFRNPSMLLKEVQRRIKVNLLDTIILPQNVHGGVKGKSNITNAKCHQGKKYRFATDLQEFYPNIKAKTVYNTLVDLKFTSHFSYWITKLITFKNEVPQGSPASTSIANLVFLKTDYSLIDLCKKNEITYSRYVDDLTFSSQKDFHKLIEPILNLVLNNGFKISRRKTKYDGKQSITGIEVSLNKIDAPQKIKENAIQEQKLNTNKKPYTIYLNNIRKTNKK